MLSRRRTDCDRAVAGPATAFLVLVVAVPTVAEESPATRPIQIDGRSCVDAGCHAAITEPKYLHGPVVVGACERCHLETDHANHKYRPVAEPPALCFACHVKFRARLEDPTTRPYHHPPVDEGKCLDCHNPHSSGHPKMLRKDSVVELCMGCHQDKLSLVGHVHKPITEKGCLECHRGHDSDNPKLLRQPPTVLCVRCHGEKYQSFISLTSVHPPAGEKNCIGCHTPHASPAEKLLARTYSPGRYQPFDPEHYALCFACHKKELATEPATTEDTNFRNGDRNLHFVHVHKDEKGRSCRICHRPHGSPLARLIRPSVPFGDWAITIRYVPTKTGGYCAAACHPAKRYDRQVPIDMNREPVKPQMAPDEP